MSVEATMSFYIFFQAEDGIRDTSVTGVQTCALPIFIDLAGEINTAMPYHVVEAVSVALNERQKSVKGSRILVFGIAYKKDVDDLRESPALEILQLLRDRGAHVDYHDPYFARLHRMRHYDFSKMTSVAVDGKNLASYDCVVIATDHSNYDYQHMVNDAPRARDLLTT